jgi:hypothetical protein
MWKKLVCLIIFVLVLAPCKAVRATDYYVSPSGNDSNSGTSPEQAWKSLVPVNSTTFLPGDSILFKADGQWTGQLKPQGLGAEGSPIVIDMYGEGAKPCIDGAGTVVETLLLYNVEYWEINNLEITNWSPTDLPQGKGVYIHINNFGTAHHIHLKNLYIHDIRGDYSGHASGSGDGINWLNEGSSVLSRFDGLLIEDCHIAQCDLDGIWGWSEYWARDNWYPSLNVVIRGNLVEDVGLHGIVPIGCDGALVEYNVLRGAVQKYSSGCGIWPWSCDNTIVQFNEASGVEGSWDGWGFDSDWNSQNNIFQYNYSHDNEVGFMLVCTPAVASWNLGNRGTIVRYNISQNDGWGASDHYPATIRIIGPCEDTYVYGNTIYVGSSLDIPVLDLGWSWQGWSTGNYFYNNIFYVDGQASHTFGSSTNNVFSNNVWYGNHTGAPYDPNAITADPMLVEPNSGGDGMDTLDGYKLQAGSPCIDAGTDIPDSGGWDFWGNEVPSGDGYDVGAHEYAPLVPAEVDITPQTLNLASKGRWITCHISLPEDYNVADIEPNSVMLENEPNDIYADWIRLEGEAAMAKFKRWEVREMLTELGQLGRVELFVSGELNDGTRFEGTDTILVINRGNKK